MTTHYMDEAENCDRVAIIDYGQIVVMDTLETLKDSVGGDVISVKTEDNEAAMRVLVGDYKLCPSIRNDVISFAVPRGEEFLPGFVSGFPVPVLSVGLARPTMEDVFLKVTGRTIREQEADPMHEMKQMVRGRGRGR